MGKASGLANSRGALLHTTAPTAEAEAVFKNVLLEIRDIVSSILNHLLSQISGTPRLSPNRFRRRIPGCNLVIEISVVGQVAADRRMVAKLLVLHGRLAGSNRVEKIRLMGRHIAVSVRRPKSLRLDQLVVERPGLR